MSRVRTRMAPSPTGEYHIGGMRTLLYNYALAKKDGGQFILRIEDTDQERLVPGATERLIQVIRDYGLDWDEGPVVDGPHAPYVQSQRLSLYKEYAEKLVENGHAYYCFCTKERLDTLRAEQQAKGIPATKYDKHCLKLSKDEVAQKLKNGEPFVVRLNVKPGEEVTFEDKILGQITFPTNDIDDQVLLKSDGFPTYHLAVVIDDHLMEINVVMRGMEWLPSTPKHILLYKAFGWELPQFAHLPLLKEKGDSRKLSKRMGSVAAVEFLSEGYLPEALLNFLMLLGWNPGTEQEIFSLEEFIKVFSVEKVHKTDLVVFDRDKLLWFNGYYIRNMPAEKLWERLQKWSVDFKVDLHTDKKDENFNVAVTSLIQERMKKLSEFRNLSHYFYEEPSVEEQDLFKYSGDKNKGQQILSGFLDLYKNYDNKNWTVESLENDSHIFAEKNGYTFKEAFMTLRVAITGETATPPVFNIVELLGKNTVTGRLEKALKI